MFTFAKQNQAIANPFCSFLTCIKRDISSGIYTLIYIALNLLMKTFFKLKALNDV